ncbi:hypothetical protein XENORESO_020153 [Xenotaenia resolanae]|uniref:Uncharacterized protein n=1 Tax=Xenotaenia resolanae TaxID=208358 RepID=A0ABV0VP06_9TELE
MLIYSTSSQVDQSFSLLLCASEAKTFGNQQVRPNRDDWQCQTWHCQTRTPQEPDTNCKAWWGRVDDLGLFIRIYQKRKNISNNINTSCVSVIMYSSCLKTMIGFLIFNDC